MTDEEFEWIKHEAAERDQRLERMEEAGIAETVKYFDRIHDKLFSLNSFLIAGYFTMIAIRDGIPAWSIVIASINSIFLLWIDYRMMRKSRIESRITKVSSRERQKVR